ncbi:MAG: DedA family protein [Gammaproteobacteria bacterium]|nr:DedA family protein [Gammaproteobacteria bacterium]MDH4313548.1 DedA family protein [Gammaproteobacteria bacterium]MDH5212617.1 DedA family protein [Gammaproteobacteria bacterium]MDH5501065.1 DedA family protein [Gammaproteobacteria bacterium]
MRLFEPLYRRVLALSAHPQAERYLAALSFAESSFFPIPPDVMLAPMCLAERHRAWRFAATTTVMSLLGGVAGYAIGYFLIDMIEPWLRSSGSYDSYLRVRDWFAVWGVWAVFVAGFSPIPYKLFTIAAGATVLNIPGFLLASLIGRGARFFLVAGLIVAGGDRMAAGLQQHVERIGWAVVVIAVLLGSYFVLRQ